MPRRYHEYLPEFAIWHQMSTIGAFIFGLGLFMILGYFIKSLINGEKAPHNPWGGMSMEWETATAGPEAGEGVEGGGGLGVGVGA